MNKAFYLWRLLATGWSFAIFSLGGLILAVFVFPVINLVGLITSDMQSKHRRAQAVIHHTFKFFLWQMSALGIMRMHITGIERLQGANAKLILANHPTLIDVVLLISIVKYTNCVVKQSLFRDPFLRGTVRAAGFINNDGTSSVIDDCADVLNNGENLIIFPEGTRSVPGQALRFQRGAGHIAARSHADIVPVTITCDPPTLTKAHKWYHIPDRPFHLTAEIGEPLDISDIVAPEVPPTLISRRVTDYLRDYFTKRLEQFEIARART